MQFDFPHHRGDVEHDLDAGVLVAHDIRHQLLHNGRSQRGASSLNEISVSSGRDENAARTYVSSACLHQNSAGSASRGALYAWVRSPALLTSPDFDLRPAYALHLLATEMLCVSRRRAAVISRLRSLLAGTLAYRSRSILVAIAASEITTHGYTAASENIILDLADEGKGVLYLHFKCKAELAVILSTAAERLCITITERCLDTHFAHQPACNLLSHL